MGSLGTLCHFEVSAEVSIGWIGYEIACDLEFSCVK